MSDFTKRGPDKNFNNNFNNNSNFNKNFDKKYVVEIINKKTGNVVKNVSNDNGATMQNLKDSLKKDHSKDVPVNENPLKKSIEVIEKQKISDIELKNQLLEKQKLEKQKFIFNQYKRQKYIKESGNTTPQNTNRFGFVRRENGFNNTVNGNNRFARPMNMEELKNRMQINIHSNPLKNVRNNFNNTNTNNTTANKPIYKNVKDAAPKPNNFRPASNSTNKKKLFIKKEEIEKTIPRTLNTKRKTQKIERREIIITDEKMTLRELSKISNISVSILNETAKGLGVIKNDYDLLTSDEMSLILELNDCNVNVNKISDRIKEFLKDTEANEERIPVVVVAGHVDHGKTSLLDYIRKTNVTDKEKGGITQKISIDKVEKNGGMLFIDTPGHNVFSVMREVGFIVTDIVVIVVAADDGIQPQTIEVIENVKNRNIAVIIAITKVDKFVGSKEKLYSSFLQYGLTPTKYGGDINVVEVSSKTGEGIDTLLDIIQLEKSKCSLMYNKNRHGVGYVLDSCMEKGFGIVASVLLKNGTIRTGDNFIIGRSEGKVKLLFANGKNVKEASCNDIIKVTGLNVLPDLGEEIIVVNDKKLLEEFLSHREDLQQYHSAIVSDHCFNREIINILLKTDTLTSINSLEKVLKGYSNKHVVINIFAKELGDISSLDIKKAEELNLTIVGFRVKKADAKTLIKIIASDIIYDILDEINKITNKTEIIKKETKIGVAEVRKIFTFDKTQIAGCMIINGIIKRKVICEVVRGDKVIHRGELLSMKRQNDDLKEAKEGYEVGIILNNFNNFQVNDKIIGYEIIEEVVNLS